MDLTKKKCVPCEAGGIPLQRVEFDPLLKQVPEWEVKEEKKLSKVFKFKDFVEAMQFVHRVAEVAEGEGHHPDLHIFYNKVTVELWTHEVGGLSENDFIVAAKIDTIK